MTDAKHPFFRPLWRRVLVVAVCFAWSAVEWAHDETTWGVITLLLGLYGVWIFFIRFEAGDDTDQAPPRP